MNTDEIKELFDIAYTHMLAGEFAASAECFQRIIDSNKNSYAAKVAEQKLHWYCMPIQAIFEEMKSTSAPVNILKVVINLFEKEGVEPSNCQNLVIQIESELIRMESCARIGTNIWVLKSELRKCVLDIVGKINHTNEPIYLPHEIVSYWPAFSTENPEFPDSTSTGIVSTLLHEYQIEIINRDYAVPSSAINSAVSQFQDLILASRFPIDLITVLPALFPSYTIEKDQLIGFRDILKVNFDHNFVRVCEDYWYLRELLNFGSEQLEEAFGELLAPISTKNLANKILFPNIKQSPVYTNTFINALEEKLASNTLLEPIGNGIWFLKSRLTVFLLEAVRIVYEAKCLLDSRDIVRKIIANNPSGETVRFFSSRISNFFRTSKDIIRLPGDNWIHKSVLILASENSYLWLLEQEAQQTTGNLLRHALPVERFRQSDLNSLIDVFASYLSKDDRFIYDTISRKWRAVPAERKHNELAIDILQIRHFPMTIDEMINGIHERYEIKEPILDLERDRRFQKIGGTNWALSSWKNINDQAIEFLQSTHHPQYTVTIISAVCERINIDENQAIFTPLDDYRFASASHQRWVARYFLTDDDVEECHKLLSLLLTQGLSLNALITRILHKEAGSTDAERRLAQDTRFLVVDGKYYSKEAALYALSDDDIENLVRYLAEHRSECPIAIEVLVKEGLERNSKFTNADERLRGDSRFEEIGSGFWSAAGYSMNAPERGANPAVAIHHQPTTISTAIPPVNLTPRRRRRGASPVPVEQVFLTLALLDIRYGNIHIPEKIRDWLPDGDDIDVELTDEKGFRFLGRVYEARSLLQIASWLKRRELSYGDKVSIQPGQNPGTLIIAPTGERDKNVESEAISHLNVDELVEEARRVNKSYHDLMIEVMEMIGGKLHREDIFQLVDYQRTATRQSIFQTLSLVDCPFEELRYFVPEGNGYWSFSRQRKEAYDMKMQELLDTNSSLQGRIVLLENQVETQKIQIQTLQQNAGPDKEELAALRKKLEDLQAHLAGSSAKEQQLLAYQQELEELNLQLQHDAEKLSADLNQAQTLADQIAAHRDGLLEEIQRLSGKIESITAEKQAISQSLEEALIITDKQVRSIQDFENRIQEFEKTIADLQHQIAESEESYREIMATLQSLEIQKAELDARLLKKAEELDAASGSVEQLKSQIEQLQQKYDRVVASSTEDSLQSQLFNEALKKEIGELREQLAQAEDQEKVLGYAKVLIEELRSALSNEKQIHQDEKARMQAEIDSLASQISAMCEEHQKAIATLQEENRRLTDEITSLQLTSEEQRQLSEDLGNQIHQLKELNAKQIKELTSMKKKMARIDKAFNTRLGKLFVKLSHLNS